ncbi:Coiled-coil and C2 domain-containing protein 1B, partial [Podochytrium sp. JEL0797]
MSWFGASRPTEVPDSPPLPSGFDDLDALGHIDEGDVESDAALLAELALLSGSGSNEGPLNEEFKGESEKPLDELIEAKQAAPGNDHLDESDLSKEDLLLLSELPAETRPQPVKQSSSIPLIDIKRRQLEYKQAALAFKQYKDVARAREMLLVSKSLQDPIDMAEAGSPIPASFALPPSPPAPSALPPPSATPATPATPAAPSPSFVPPSNSTPPRPTQTPISTPTIAPSLSTASTLTPSILANSPSLLQTLHANLTSQIQTCTQISHYALKTKQKPLAVEYHRRKKLYQSDLQVLDAMLASTSVTTHPSFRYEVVRYELENQCVDVEVEELEVGVVRGFDYVASKACGVAGSAELETFVVFDVGWPATATAGVTAEDGKGQSKVVSKSASPEYGFTKKVKIERTSRAFQRHLERKRAMFDVYHQSKGWGFSLFSKPIHLGRASVALNTLLTKSELHEVVDLVDPANPRKLTGGKLEIKLRVRVPFLKPDLIIKEERWVM